MLELSTCCGSGRKQACTGRPAIGENVVIPESAAIGPRCVIEEGVRIGERVYLQTESPRSFLDGEL